MADEIRMGKVGSQKGGIRRLDDAEKARFSNLEEVVSVGMQSFVEVGEALQAIRDERLYEEEFPTWNAYLATRWGFNDRRARQLIAGSQVTRRLQSSTDNPTGTMVPTSARSQLGTTSDESVSTRQLPSSERVVRELVALEEDDQQRVWDEAVQSSEAPPTARDVRTAAERLGVVPPKTPKKVDGLRPAPDISGRKTLMAAVNDVRDYLELIQDDPQPQEVRWACLALGATRLIEQLAYDPPPVSGFVNVPATGRSTPKDEWKKKGWKA